MGLHQSFMSQGRACSLRFAPHFKLRLILPKRALTHRCLLIPRAPSPHSSPHTFSAPLFKSFFKTPVIFKSISSAAASPPSSQLLGAKFVVQMPRLYGTPLKITAYGVFLKTGNIDWVYRRLHRLFTLVAWERTTTDRMAKVS